jgi:sulfur-oxidizing protein SoxB
MDYSCAPNETAGQRISDMTLDDGTPIDAGKTYRVAGWASVNPQNGDPVMAVVEKYLRANKSLTIKRPNRVTLKGVANNPGIIGGG